MAIVDKCGLNVARANGEYGMEVLRSTSFGRKRVSLLNVGTEFGNDDEFVAATRPKRYCSLDKMCSDEKSALEEMPQEVLVRILCGVEHDDLKRLLFVSRAIREAALIAKKSHFAYSTPRKTLGFQNVDYFGDSNEVEAPNAPKQTRVPRKRLGAKELADITVALFAFSDDDDDGDVSARIEE